MDMNRAAGEIYLDEKDISILGEPKFKPTEPITRAQEILGRAETRAAANQDRASVCAPEHVNRDSVRSDITSTGLRLNAICIGMRNILAPANDTAEDIESRVEQWAREFGAQ